MDGVGFTCTCVKESRDQNDDFSFPPLISAQGCKGPTRMGLQQPESAKPKSENKSRCSKGHASPTENILWGCHHSLRGLAQVRALVASATLQGLCQSDFWSPRDMWQGGRCCDSTLLSHFVLLCCLFPSVPTWRRRISKAAGLCPKDPPNKQQISNNWFNK